MKKIVGLLPLSALVFILTACSTHAEPSAYSSSIEYEPIEFPVEREISTGDKEACDITANAFNQFATVYNEYVNAGPGEASSLSRDALEKFRDQSTQLESALDTANDPDLIEQLTRMERNARTLDPTELGVYGQNMYFFETQCNKLGTELSLIEVESSE